MTVSKLDYAALKKLAPAGFELPQVVKTEFDHIVQNAAEYKRSDRNSTDPAKMRIRLNPLHASAHSIDVASREIKKVTKEIIGAQQMAKYRQALDDHIELLRKYEKERVGAIAEERRKGNGHNVDVLMGRDKTDKMVVF